MAEKKLPKKPLVSTVKITKTPLPVVDRSVEKLTATTLREKAVEFARKKAPQLEIDSAASREARMPTTANSNLPKIKPNEGNFALKGEGQTLEEGRAVAEKARATVSKPSTTYRAIGDNIPGNKTPISKITGKVQKAAEVVSDLPVKKVPVAAKMPSMGERIVSQLQSSHEAFRGKLAEKAAAKVANWGKVASEIPYIGGAAKPLARAVAAATTVPRRLLATTAGGLAARVLGSKLAMGVGTAADLYTIAEGANEGYNAYKAEKEYEDTYNRTMERRRNEGYQPQAAPSGMILPNKKKSKKSIYSAPSGGI